MATLGVCNNNVLNIRYNKANDWHGQIGENKGFCVFSNIDCGLRAALIILRNYLRIGVNTPYKIINRFAPACENDTLSYISFVSGPWSDDKNHIIRTVGDLSLLVSKMAYFESRYVVSPDYVRSVFDYYKLKL